MGCCYKGLFLLSPSPLSSVDCVELKLECITSALHRRGRGEGRCLNLTSYCVSVSRVLTRVVVRNRISFCNLVCRIVRFALSIVLCFPIPSLPWQLYLSQMENICSDGPHTDDCCLYCVIKGTALTAPLTSTDVLNKHFALRWLYF